jgi:hypothetical protein
MAGRTDRSLILTPGPLCHEPVIRTREPQTIVEVGGGLQTRIAQMACEKNGMGRILCVDRNPSEFVQAVQGIELTKRCVQDVETGFFNTALRDGDMLFIDSTHTVKHDSDCRHVLSAGTACHKKPLSPCRCMIFICPKRLRSSICEIGDFLE